MNRKIKFLSILLTLLMVLPLVGPALTFETDAATASGVWDGTIATKFAGGNGTVASPYEISNGSELAYLAKLINDDATYASYKSKHYKLTADINLGNKEWTPIGGLKYGYTTNNEFTGVLDGGIYDAAGKLIGRHTISNLYMAEPKPIGAGLFGRISGSSTKISNLILSGKITAGTDNSGVAEGKANSIAGAGMLVNACYGGTISNVTVYSDICVKSTAALTGFYAGGICGYACGNTKFVNCEVFGTLELKISDKDVHAGGAVGRARGASFENVHSDVDLYIRDAKSDVTHQIGGLIGYSNSDSGKNDTLNMKGCSATGNIHFNSSYASVNVGGLVGRVGLPVLKDENGNPDYTKGGIANISDCSFDGKIYVTVDSNHKTNQGTINKGAIAAIMSPYSGTVQNFYTSATITDDFPYYHKDDAEGRFVYNETGTDDGLATTLDLTDKRGHIDGITVASKFGAAMRLYEESTGVRFTSTIDRTLYNELITAAKDANRDFAVQLGTLIAPTDYVESAKYFSKELLDQYAIDMGYPAGYLNVTFTHKDAPSAAQLEPEKLSDWLDVYYDDDTVHHFSGAIINIMSGNIDRCFSGVGYVELTSNGYSHIFYADYTDAGRSRTARYIAEQAIKDVSDVYDEKEYQYSLGNGQYSKYSASQRELIQSFLDANNPSTMDVSDLVLVENGKSKYAIVYPTAASDAEYKLAVYLQHVIKAMTGVELPVREDRASGIVKTTEIMVGCFERNSATYHINFANYKDDAYSVSTNGKRILILGETTKALACGVLAFVQECFGVNLTTATSLPSKAGETVTAPRHMRLLSTDENAITPLTATLEGYTVVYSTDMQKRMAYSLSDAYKAATGVELTVSNASATKQIVLTDDATLTNGDWSIATTGSTTITVKAGSYYGFEGAEDYIIETVLQGLAPITKASFTTSGNYASWVGSGFEEATQYAYDKNGTLRVMYYNVLFGASAKSGDNTVDVPPSERNPLQAEMIAQYQPDVLACQEFNYSKRFESAWIYYNSSGYNWSTFLSKFVSYDTAGYHHEAKSNTTGDQGLVALLKAKGYTEAIDPRVKNSGLWVDDGVAQNTTNSVEVTYNGETFRTFFNNTPLFYNSKTTKFVVDENGNGVGGYHVYENQKNEEENPGVGDGDCASKSFTWGLFETIATGQRYIVISTHMCTLSNTVRGLQAQELIDFIDTELRGYNVPIFLGGDLNGDADDLNYQAFIEEGYHDLGSTESAALFSSELRSSHGNPDYDETRGMMVPKTDIVSDTTQYRSDYIDRILIAAKDEFVGVNVFAVVSDECTRSGSDHYPVFMDAVIKKNGDGFSDDY